MFVLFFAFNTVYYGCLIFVGIKFSWISLGFLSMIIYEIYIHDSVMIHTVLIN